MSFLSRITVVCFTASYGVALALEIVRIFYRNPLRRILTLVFAAAGLFAHSVFLANRAVGATGAPLSSAFDWYLLAAWALVVAYLYLNWHYPQTASGLFVLPLVLGLIGMAKFADRDPFPQSHAGQIWGFIHGLFLLMGLVTVALGFVAGLMYLIQAYRLKHKLPSNGGIRLPSLEWLERVNSRSILISVFMIGIGFVSGIVLNMILSIAKSTKCPGAIRLSGAPARCSRGCLAAAIFSGVYRPARGGRKVAYLTVASFAFLVAALAIKLLIPSEHGGEKAKSEVGGPVVRSLSADALRYGA